MIAESLVGKFFHTTSRCEAGHVHAETQGRVLLAEGGLLLVETFGFGDGMPYAQGLVRVDEFHERGAFFYEDAQGMRADYEDRFAPLATCEVR